MISKELEKKFGKNLINLLRDWLSDPIVLKHVQEETEEKKIDNISGIILDLHNNLEQIVNEFDRTQVSRLGKSIDFIYAFNLILKDRKDIFNILDAVNKTNSDYENRIEKQKIVWNFIENIFRQALTEYIEVRCIDQDLFKQEDLDEREKYKSKIRYMLYNLQDGLGLSLGEDISNQTKEVINKYIEKIAFENQLNPDYREERMGDRGRVYNSQRLEEENSSGFILEIFLEDYLNRCIANKISEITENDNVKFENFTLEKHMFNDESRQKNLNNILLILEKSINEHNKYLKHMRNTNESNVLLKALDDVVIELDMLLYRAYYPNRNKLGLSPEIFENLIFDIRENIVMELSKIYNPKLDKQDQIDIQDKKNILYERKIDGEHQIKLNNELLALYTSGDKYLLTSSFWKEMAGSAFMLGNNSIDNNPYVRYHVVTNEESIMLRFSKKMSEEKQKEYLNVILETLSESILTLDVFEDKNKQKINKLQRKEMYYGFNSGSDNVIQKLNTCIREISIFEEMSKIKKESVNVVKSKI